jgi:hypothetical protein
MHPGSGQGTRERGLLEPKNAFLMPRFGISTRVARLLDLLHGMRDIHRTYACTLGAELSDRGKFAPAFPSKARRRYDATTTLRNAFAYHDYIAICKHKPRRYTSRFLAIV